MTCDHRIDKKCFNGLKNTRSEDRNCPKYNEEIDDEVFQDNSAVREILKLQPTGENMVRDAENTLLFHTKKQF